MARQRRIREEAQRRKRNRRLFMLWGLVGVIVVAVVAVLVGIQQANQAETKGQHTPEEIHKFWEEHLDTLIMKQLWVPAHANDTVNLIIRERYRLISQRYNNPKFDFVGVESYGPRDAGLGTSRGDGVVSIKFFVPALMDDFYRIGADRYPVQRHIFENGVIIGYIHELDHLAFDPIESPSTLEERVKSESITWARTVQSIELLVSKSAFQLHPSEQAYYNAWLRSGKKEDSKEWQSFIRDTYRHTLP